LPWLLPELGDVLIADLSDETAARNSPGPARGMLRRPSASCWPLMSTP